MNKTTEFYFPECVFKIIKDFLLPNEYDRLERYGYDKITRCRCSKNEMRFGRDGSIDRYFFDDNGKRRDFEINKDIKDQFTDSELLMTKTHNFDTTGRVYVTLNAHLMWNYKSCFVKNVRFANESIINDIETIYLEMNGTRIDILDCKFYHVLQNFYKMEKYIP